MLRVGLTGGIACGKSTVAEMFRELGYPVLDADLVAHEMLEPGNPTHDAVLREFENIENPDASISRPKLAAIVFADKEKLARLNAIMHPEIARRMAKWFTEQAVPERPPFAICQAALLVEAGYKNRLDRLVIVNCGREQQLERLAARGLNERDAVLRIDAQLPSEEKMHAADDVIDTSGSLEETRRQVTDLAQKLSCIGEAANPQSNKGKSI
jgi:dephospho-CoA kinase